MPDLVENNSRESFQHTAPMEQGNIMQEEEAARPYTHIRVFKAHRKLDMVMLRAAQSAAAKAPGNLGNHIAGYGFGKEGRQARTKGLAYGALRGVSYARMEGKARTEPDWKAIKLLVERYGVRHDWSLPRYDHALLRTQRAEQTARWEAWLAEAKAHFKENRLQ